MVVVQNKVGVRVRDAEAAGLGAQRSVVGKEIAHRCLDGRGKQIHVLKVDEPCIKVGARGKARLAHRVVSHILRVLWNDLSKASCSPTLAEDDACNDDEPK